MKKFVVLVTVIAAFLFVFGVTVDGFARVGLPKDAGDAIILKEMMSANPKEALPAIGKVKAGAIKDKVKVDKAKGNLIRIIETKKKKAEIRIAAADAIAALGVKRAVPHLKRLIKAEKAADVKTAFQNALDKLEGKKGTIKETGTPTNLGTPSYMGTPSGE